MSKEWWKNFFNEDYIDLWIRRSIIDSASTKKQIHFLEKYIPLKKKDLILDLCCGHGRHSMELAQRGYKVVGLEYSKFALDLAKREAKKIGLGVKFLRADARSFSFKKKFDVILSMFTSFGYGTKEEDQKIIQNVCKHLRKDGKFLIDLHSLPHVWFTYLPKNMEKFGKMIVKTEKKFDFLHNVNHEKRVTTLNGRKKVYRVTVRIYTLAELAQLLEKGNLKVLKYWGWYDGQPYGLHSRRLVVLAKKAK